MVFKSEHNKNIKLSKQKQKRNKDVATIEEDLEKAFYDCELIPSYNYGFIDKL